MVSSAELRRETNTVQSRSLEDDVIETATAIAEKDKALVQIEARKFLSRIASGKMFRKFVRTTNAPLKAIDSAYQEWTREEREYFEAEEKKILAGIEMIKESTIRAFQEWND